METQSEFEQYTQQIAKAKETLGVLENELYQIRLQLKNQPNEPKFLRELKRITLDMTITLNEIEHSQESLDNCKPKTFKIWDRYEG